MQGICDGKTTREGRGLTSPKMRQQLVQRLRESGISDERVLLAIENTPRHLFVDGGLTTRAYEDTALPIGFGQTISQPYIVARMTELALNGARPDKVLEVGVGCGYQCAVLAGLVDQVFGIERIAALVNSARLRLQQMGHMNVRIKHGDGYAGWEYHGSYQAIILAAAPHQVPEALLAQLAMGGRLIAPIGDARSQKLVMVERTNHGFHRSELETVSFVPLLSGVV